MAEKIVTAAEERRRFEESLLPAFDEIARTFLATAPGEADALQQYLDGMVEVAGVRYRRRTVLLAIHDMKEERAAPLALQNDALAQLILMKVRPIPLLKNYRDVATAILRMEVVIRLIASSARQHAQLEAASHLQPLALQTHGPVASGPWPNA
jgi:hypothetical protein